MYGLSCTQAFNCLTHFIFSLGHRHSASNSQSKTPISTLVIGTGQNQITEAGQAHHGFLKCAKAPAQTHLFRQPSCHQRGASIGSKAQSICGAHGYCKDILQCAT